MLFIRKSLISGILLAATATATPTLADSKFSDAWNATSEKPYAGKLPVDAVSRRVFIRNGVNLLRQSAARTLVNYEDFLPEFQKFVHLNGICFAGTWSIDKKSQYTGYFAEGSEGLIIMRASEAMGQPLSDGYRSFGLAGKIYPTKDEKDQTEYRTANFFTVDDLGGAAEESFLTLPKFNEPKTSFHASALGMLATLTSVVRALAGADSYAGIRQVYEVAELVLNDPTRAITPYHMALQATFPGKRDKIRADFRDELRLANFKDGLNFGIYVKEREDTEWQRLGMVRLKQEALSWGCDHRLHFHHPKAK